MGILTVSREIDATTGIESLPIENIAFLEYDRMIDRVIVHTIDEVFFMTGTLKYWQNALEASGYNFATVDRTNVVNLDKIVKLDQVYHVAYFEENITQSSKRCTFTHINFVKVQQKYAHSNSSSALGFI